MKMIPEIPHGTHSLAEKRVFDQLRLAFEDQTSTQWVAYHSLNLTRHAYKRFGEIDFLISGPSGIMVLEVKGGGVACHNGIWQFTNRYGNINESTESPFRQAESALHGLREKLRTNLSESLLSQFTLGYGVIFPDCDWRVEGAEWERAILADARDFRDFNRWLKNLFRHWQKRDFKDRQPSSDLIQKLRGYLRPEFEAVIPLHVQARETEERVVALTEDQMVLVDVVAANPRVMCSGGAGTGKTFMAMELARRWTAQEMNVALVCQSPWLKHYLETRFSLPMLTVTLAESIKMACRREGIDGFDALIIDEGQDLCDMESLDRLDSTLKGGLNNGHWCFFYDVNNQAGLWGKQDPEAINYLQSTNPVNIPLSINCRNTQVILDKVKKSLNADMGVRGAGQGPKVREKKAMTREISVALLEAEIQEIIDEGGIASKNLTLLSPYPFNESSAALLPKSRMHEIVILDEYSLRNFPPNKISFAEIQNFKGLENEAIIIIDISPPDAITNSLAKHYVAMSRARAILSIIYITNY